MTFPVLMLAATVSLPLAGAVRLADPFADGMVLQRGMPVPVWGTAAPGEKVTVAFIRRRKGGGGRGAGRPVALPSSAAQDVEGIA